MKEAKKIPDVSRQTVLQRVKSGKLSAVHVLQGKQIDLYTELSSAFSFDAHHNRSLRMQPKVV